MTDAPSLADWLLERIAEDEAVARAASVLTEWDPETREHVPIPSEPAIWVAGDGYGSGAVERTNGHPLEPGIVVYDEGSPNEAEAAHIARHDPARVLARCEADREIVRLHSGTSPDCMGGYVVGMTHREVAESALLNGVPTGWCDTLRALASAYADEPGFREEWR